MHISLSVIQKALSLYLYVHRESQAANRHVQVNPGHLHPRAPQIQCVHT